MPPHTHAIVLDTSMLLAAIGQGRFETENNSPHDKNLRARDIEPEKIRGHILQALLTKNVVVPHIVYLELEAQINNPQLSSQNQKNLKILLQTLQGLTTKIVPSRLDVFAQRNGLESIKHAATLEAHALAEKNPHLSSYLQNWEDLSLYTKEHANNEALAQIKQHIKALPVCLTWCKLKSYMPQAQANTEDILGQPKTVKTAQIALLEEVETITREIELAQEEITSSTRPIPDNICEILTDYAKKLKEKNQTISPNLTPEVLTKLPKHIQKESFLFLAEKLKPFLIPDYEIALVAYKNKAKILTLDSDFSVLQTHIGKLKTMPAPENKAIGPNETLLDFLLSLKKNLKKYKVQQTHTADPCI